ncbi:hypothetical protein [Streptomyces sp. B15]|uniref:hypothetical protein n=1 Tax=Streptomyces sp. B15 TaxID=1537797 RepID=UPI001B35DEF9|nr:hypothetical protein [Streptomyces sp. B15]MBQ1119799.1 hypothetical protein [Streptomyces sp. B15]
MDEPSDPDTRRRWRTRHDGAAGDQDEDEDARPPAEGCRRPGVQASDVLAALALAIGVVLGTGTWRAYLAHSMAPEGEETAESQGRALAGPKEGTGPARVTANAAPAHRSGVHHFGTRRPTRGVIHPAL